MVPQICTACPPGTEPQEIKSETPGWGIEGNMTLFVLACEHMFLLHTNYDGS